MENRAVDAIIDDIFQILPAVYKRLLKIDLPGMPGGLSRLHLAIMGILSESKLPISEIGKQLMIPRPYMTRLIDWLEKRAIVERQPDAQDRRVINIALTETGVQTLSRWRRLVRNDMKQKLSFLTEAELEELASSLQKIREIGLRLK
jgi:DNA-binding MarR family transcriptional regulator